MQPNVGIKKGFGLLKKHKINEPLRPIISSVNSLTEGAESFLAKIFAPFVKKCKYSVESTKQFKEKFLDARSHFSEDVEVTSFDAVSLFTNINIKKVVNYLLDKIYLSEDTAREVFNETMTDSSGTEILLEIPPRDEFYNFIISVLTKFSSFSSNAGFFRQLGGVSMGGKLSAQLANIFVNMMEEEVIRKHIEAGDIIFYTRYVDDVFCAYKKGKVSSILNGMNSFDPLLKFEIDKMINNNLNFLDTSCFLDENKVYQLKMFIKPTASAVKTNFTDSIQPLKYKISTLVNDFYRCKYTTTSTSELNNALKK